jgi:hypothetical protein
VKQAAFRTKSANSCPGRQIFPVDIVRFSAPIMVKKAFKSYHVARFSVFFPCLALTRGEQPAYLP